jgi:putative hydrolase of the HAD superfamily
MTGVAKQSTTLLIDADDTLWQNNIYFERATEEFLDFLAHSTLTRAEARAALDEIERANIAIHGYGALGFAASLHACYLHLVERELDETEIEQVMWFGRRILEQPIELIEGVEETLIELATRCQLVLYTKGHHEEQKLKIERSGIGHLFAHHEVVSEKHVDGYRALIDRHALDPARGWMIGNSPKSDINPALAAGLGAVFIPHDDTWHLEHAVIDHAGDRLLTLERFTQLVNHF